MLPVDDRRGPRFSRPQLSHGTGQTAPHHRRQSRFRLHQRLRLPHRPGRRRRARRRPVDDDDGYRRRRVHGAAVRRTGRSGIGDGAHHGEPAGSGRRRPRNQAADARRRLHRPADRRLPLQRPPAPHAPPGLRRRARQIPHQSGQRRHRQAPRRTVHDDLPGRPRSRQTGAHRRQRRLAQSGAGPAEDAGEHGSQSRTHVRGDPQRVHGDLGARIDRAGDRGGPAEGPDHHLVQGLAAAAPGRRLPRARAQTDQPLHLGLTEAGMGTRGWCGRPPRWASC